MIAQEVIRIAAAKPVVETDWVFVERPGRGVAHGVRPPRVHCVRTIGSVAKTTVEVGKLAGGGGDERVVQHGRRGRVVEEEGFVASGGKLRRFLLRKILNVSLK